MQHLPCDVNLPSCKMSRQWKNQLFEDVSPTPIKRWCVSNAMLVYRTEFRFGTYERRLAIAWLGWLVGKM